MIIHQHKSYIVFTFCTRLVFGKPHQFFFFLMIPSDFLLETHEIILNLFTYSVASSKLCEQTTFLFPQIMESEGKKQNTHKTKLKSRRKKTRDKKAKKLSVF